MKDDPLITYRRKPVNLDLQALESFAEILWRRVARAKTFHCRITDDEELRSLNARFRKKNYATDVLSFPSGNEGGDPETKHIGDIAISLARARAQAKEFGHTLDEELRILLLHGLLHLLGFDHETDGGQMARAESRWRKQFALPQGLIRRANAEVPAGSRLEA